MKKIMYIFLFSVSLVLLNNSASAQCDKTKSHSANGKCDKSKSTSSVDCKSDKVKIAAVNFHADDCNISKTMETKIVELDSKLDESVVFVNFDMSDESSKANTVNFAAEQGLNPVLESNSGTGYIVLFDVKSKKILGKLDNSQSVNDMEKTIKNFL